MAQSEGGDAVGALSFNCIRSIIGGVALIPAIKLLDKLGYSRKPATAADKKTLLIGGVSCGVVLCIATNLQQIGINSGTPAGKAGFLTACYIVIVPILGLFLKRKCGLNVWVGVALTLVGLYFLCILGNPDAASANSILNVQRSDALVLLCALVFSVHILVIDRFAPRVDGVRMSCIQFLVAGIITSVPMLIREAKIFEGGFVDWCGQFNNAGAWIAILYAGVLSSGVAYTLQIVGQDGVNPAVASLLLSLESVFSVLAGWVILHEVLSPISLAGCCLIFAAVVIAQLPGKSQAKSQEES